MEQTEEYRRCVEERLPALLGDDPAAVKRFLKTNGVRPRLNDSFLDHIEVYESRLGLDKTQLVRLVTKPSFVARVETEGYLDAILRFKQDCGFDTDHLLLVLGNSGSAAKLIGDDPSGFDTSIRRLRAGLPQTLTKEDIQTLRWKC